jgi:hypothetical protein
MSFNFKTESLLNAVPVVDKVFILNFFVNGKCEAFTLVLVFITSI